MKKIFRLSCLRSLLVLAVMLPFMTKAQTITPKNNTTLNELSEVTITFSSEVTLKNIDGISFILGTSTFLPPWDKPGEYGFTVVTEGNVAKIKLERPFTNLYTFEQWGTFTCEPGTFSIGGANSPAISAEWSFPPTKATIPEDPEVYPLRGNLCLSLSEITLEWPGCGVEIVGDDYVKEELRFGIQGTNFSNANIESIEAVGEAGELGYSKIVIKVWDSKDDFKPFTTKGSYLLSVPEGLIQINASDGSAMYPGDGFTFFISDYVLWPKNMARITEFPGLIIAGQNIEVKDPSQIKIYWGYFDGDPDSKPEEGTEPEAIGVSTIPAELDGDEGVMVLFDLDHPLYNGVYSVYIPANSVTTNGVGINDGVDIYDTFVVYDNLRPVPAWEADPEPGKVESLSLVKVVWGKEIPDPAALEDFYGDLLMAGSRGGATIELPDGTVKDIPYYAVNVTDGNEDVDQIQTFGSYLNINLGTTYTEEGVYTITIKEGSMIVHIDNYNDVPIDETVIVYTIGNPLILNDGIQWDPEVFEDGNINQFQNGECMISASWEGYDNPVINQEMPTAPYCEKISEEESEIIDVTEFMSVDNAKVRFDFKTFEPGNYTLVLPAFTIILEEGVMNGNASYEFEILDGIWNGVDGIIEDGIYTIYSLQGIKITETNSPNVLLTLPSGLYIINGKKVFIR